MPGRHKRKDEITPGERAEPPGRICQKSGCNTVLSRYNHQMTCYPHTEPDRSLLVLDRTSYVDECAKIAMA